jgi:hypothetical protein
MRVPHVWGVKIALALEVPDKMCNSWRHSHFFCPQHGVMHIVGNFRVEMRLNEASMRL